MKASFIEAFLFLNYYMKNLLIVYNVIFLLAGNVLFSNIHHAANDHHDHHDHLHHHEYDYENNECLECINFENNNNCILDFKTVVFSDNTNSLYINEFFSIISIDVISIYLSRAPPIS